MDIYEQIVQLRREGRRGAVATIVSVRGSIPSIRTAKMLVRDDGSIAGTVVQQPFEWAYQGFKLMAAVLKGDKSGIPANGQVIVPTKILYAADIDAYAANLKKMQGK